MSDVHVPRHRRRRRLLHDRLVVQQDVLCEFLSWTAASSFPHGGAAQTDGAQNITHHYRGEYISSILAKPISFYDHEDHSVGALTARLATDPLQLQQLLGMNMAFVVISFFNVVGCLIISFLFGWKLTAVTALTSIPIIMISAFFRVRYERQFEVMANKVFSESAKFATESIGAFRTVSSLTLENAICDRYSRLLQNHIRAAFWKNSASTSIYALSDSISLPCMAFVLWYGSKLMAEGEYWSFQFGKWPGVRDFLVRQVSQTDLGYSHRVHCRPPGRLGRRAVAEFRTESVLAPFPLL